MKAENSEPFKNKTWYKDAIIYQEHVRSFIDSNGDGIGDFKGLITKLDYLKSLGVTAIWLLPFYKSPLKDGGYDISDFTSIHEDYGTMADFKKFIQILNRDVLPIYLRHEDTFDFVDPDLPPVSYMEGVDLITEGILTLTKVGNILKDHHQNTIPDKGPAGQIVQMILQSDEIDFTVGTRINIAHQDPSLPVELEIRRTVVRRIASILEEKFLKEVKVEFI